jgi:hypothetical protein
LGWLHLGGIEMKKFWNGFWQNVDFDYFARTYGDGEPANRWTWAKCVGFELWFYAQVVVCKLRGHDFTTNGCDYPEDGGEGFSCQRCGYSFTAWH